jgi:hypothetical protein
MKPRDALGAKGVNSSDALMKRPTPSRPGPFDLLLRVVPTGRGSPGASEPIRVSAMSAEVTHYESSTRCWTNTPTKASPDGNDTVFNVRAFATRQRQRTHQKRLAGPSVGRPQSPGQELYAQQLITFLQLTPWARTIFLNFGYDLDGLV